MWSRMKQQWGHQAVAVLDSCSSLYLGHTLRTRNVDQWNSAQSRHWFLCPRSWLHAWRLSLSAASLKATLAALQGSFAKCQRGWSLCKVLWSMERSLPAKFVDKAFLKIVKLTQSQWQNTWRDKDQLILAQIATPSLSRLSAGYCRTRQSDYVLTHLLGFWLRLFQQKIKLSFLGTTSQCKPTRIHYWLVICPSQILSVPFPFQDFHGQSDRFPKA